jgi:hypothetical protein
MSDRERQMITEWSAPGSINSETGEEDAPPGRGKFLIKVAGHPGIPVQVELTAEELPLNDTNERWANRVVADTDVVLAAPRRPVNGTFR